MLKGWQEGAQNWYKISFSCSVFLQPAFSFFFSLRRGFQPPPLISPLSLPQNTTSHPSPSSLTTGHSTPLFLPLLSTKISSSAIVIQTASTPTAEVATILPKSSLPLLPAATGVTAPSSVTPTDPAESFPSPLQESAPASFSRD